MRSLSTNSSWASSTAVGERRGSLGGRSNCPIVVCVWGGGCVGSDFRREDGGRKAPAPVDHPTVLPGSRSRQAAEEDDLGAYLGTVVGGRRGEENGPAGGDLDFSCRGGGSTFCSRKGEGYLKIAKKALKMHF